MTVKLNARLVRHILTNRSMTARDLANKADIGENTVYRLMNGASFTSETLGKIADALGCHPVDLIEAEGYSSPHMVAPSVESGRA